MVPPRQPIWRYTYMGRAVYLLALHAAFGVAGFTSCTAAYSGWYFWARTGRPLRPARCAASFGALPFIFGQRKVLQRVSLRDRAGLAHFFIFWGFLSFSL